MAWTTIADANLEPGKPIRSIDGIALRDNPIAIANGDPGAPRIQTAAMSPGSINGDRLAIGSIPGNRLPTAAGAVGTTAMARFTAGTALTFGATAAGSSLKPANAAGEIISGDATFSGSWRCMGRITATGADPGAGNPAPDRTAIFLRIS